MKTLLILGLANLFMSSTVQADWQYTKWGMSIEEVKKATNEQAVFLSKEEQHSQSSKGTNDKPLLKVPYTSGKYKFNAIFIFDKNNDSLIGVRLKLINTGIASNLLGSLRSKYGNPDVEESNPPLSYSIWHQETDQISYLNVGDTLIHIDYAPRVSSDNTGL